VKKLKVILSLIFAACAVLACGYFIGNDGHTMMCAASGMVVAPDPIRAAFARAVEYFKDKYAANTVSELGLQQFNGRMLKELTNTGNAYTLDIKTKNATNTDIQAFELLAPDKQEFFVAFIRVCVRKWDATNKFLYPIFTYADANYFTTANELSSLYSLWNGTTDIVTNNNSRMVNYTNDAFNRVPGQQYELVASAQPFWPAYGPSLIEKGYDQAAPNLVMETSKVNQIKTMLKGYQAAIAGGANFNVLQVDLFGWLFSGVVPNGGECPITV
jgi:hypothetical protein